MTTSGGPTLLSIRGHAERTVDADQASIQVAVSQVRDTQEAASAESAALLTSLIDELAGLGGVVLTALSIRAPLTWSTHSMRTSEEYTKSGGSPGPTGRYTASFLMVMAVRDFTLLGRVETVLTSRDAVAVHSIDWSVDDDNPEWAHVRADAIRAALAKGQDYASALGGSIIGVEHVADAGLLNGERHGQPDYAISLSAGGSAGSGPGPASLNPEPQVLNATIEARLTATIGPLPSR